MDGHTLLLLDSKVLELIISGAIFLIDLEQRMASRGRARQELHKGVSVFLGGALALLSNGPGQSGIGNMHELGCGSDGGGQQQSPELCSDL